MSNKEIAENFSRLAKIMELHKENPFKIRSYQTANNTLRKIEKPLAYMSYDELSAIKGVGKAIAEKIIELVSTGQLQTYQQFAKKTPPGVIEMMEVRGLGAKKILVIWKDLGVETIGELLYACNENRLVELNGFGEKTQTQLTKQLQYYVDSQGKYLYGYIIDEADTLIASMHELLPDHLHSLTGGLRMLDPIVDKIELLTTAEESDIFPILEKLGLREEDGVLKTGDYPVEIYHTNASSYGSILFKTSSSQEFIKDFDIKPSLNEINVFSDNNRAYLPPEIRHGQLDVENVSPESLVTLDDLKGVIHNHSTFSDGIHSVEEMATYAKEAGYQYLVMSDHSKSAFYANGLSEDRVYTQFEMINKLNEGYEDFHIFKSIEADILNDGSIDYGNDFLAEFDLVIASVHSNLKMDKEKATKRVVTAIENPHTHILGHPTGRLLLSREGYPLDYMRVIDACAANGVVIELNANPLRLDLDWTWIPYAMEKNVMISINPDAHNRESIHYMKYGVNVARKGLLTSNMCLNTKDLVSFRKWVASLP